MSVGKFIQYIASGTAYTVFATLVALPFGLAIGSIFALFYVYGGKYVSRLMSIYSTVMRGIPPIVLLFILYFMVSGNINLSPFWAGSLSLGIVSSAYQMEIIRGALLSVSGGQMMAARSLGMSRSQAIQSIIIPQAFRLAITPWSNEAAIVIKDSSLIYALGVPEILRRAQLISASSGEPFLAFITAGLIYFLLVLITNHFLEKLDRKLQIPSHP